MNKPDEIADKQVNNTLEDFRNRTGYVITITIEFEKIIDDFLSKHFCYEQSRQEDFLNLILYNERIGLDFKRELFSIIIKKEYSSLLAEHSTVLNDLGRLPEHRNRFAHLKRVEGLEIEEIKNKKIPVWSGINVDKSLLDINIDTIIFKRYKNGGVKYLGYGQKEIDDLKAQLTNIANFMIEVYKVMQQRHLTITNEFNRIRVEVLSELRELILNPNGTEI